jgi:hypothetical protein
VSDEPGATLRLLWLDTLQHVASRAAHEIKGALNGVCVNLEVVRSRAANQAGAPASGLARFADAAAEQMEELVAMNEALLAVTRRPRDVVDVLATARQLVTLLGPAARSEGGSLALEGDAESGGATVAPAMAVRLLLASAILRALDRRTMATCRVAAGDGMVIRIECADGGALDLDPAVAAVAAESGIGVERTPSGLSLAFPRAGRSSGRRPAPTRERA